MTLYRKRQELGPGIGHCEGKWWIGHIQASYGDHINIVLNSGS